MSAPSSSSSSTASTPLGMRQSTAENNLVGSNLLDSQSHPIASQSHSNSSKGLIFPLSQETEFDLVASGGSMDTRGLGGNSLLWDIPFPSMSLNSGHDPGALEPSTGSSSNGECAHLD